MTLRTKCCGRELEHGLLCRIIVFFVYLCFWRYIIENLGELLFMSCQIRNSKKFI
nr:MAG TPA: hypothetical protein [Bacteriophage sp.]